MNKSAFYKLSYGVYVVSTWDKGRATGCTANSAMQITSEPATIAVSINHDNYTNQCIQDTGKFAVSVLGEKADPGIIGTFGFQSGRDHNKFDQVRQAVRGNMPVVADACAYIVCDVIDKLETSTHTVFLGKVTDADVLGEDTPMTYAYYHNVIKGKSPKNAPTYIAEASGLEKAAQAAEAAAKEGTDAVYKCSVCGYAYNGETPFEELPETYTCPVCGRPKSVFAKQ